MLTGWIQTLPKVDLRITVNLYEKENNRTLTKMKINTIHQNCMYFEMGDLKNWPLSKLDESKCPLPPKMVSLWYQQLWDEIEKSIFMQRETILEK